MAAVISIGTTRGVKRVNRKGASGLYRSRNAKRESRVTVGEIAGYVGFFIALWVACAAVYISAALLFL